jgi:SAM-dependent methyltransferase
MGLAPESAFQFWEQRYRSNNTPWDRGASSPALRRWLDAGALRPCRILVPGCGRGYEVVELSRRGFDVTAIDMSPTAVAHVRAALAGPGLTAEVLQADVFAYRPEKPFDAVYEQTCLCALVPDQWAGYARQLADWLPESGQLFALLMQTGESGGPPFHCDPRAMRDIFSSPDWMWPEEAPVTVPHPAGVTELGYVLTRR